MKSNNPKMWINPQILKWELFVSGSRRAAAPIVRKSYEHWYHANNLLSNAANEFVRIDIIAALKRAIDVRLRLLNQIYKFKSIPIAKKPKGLYELLEFLGIVRPLLLANLIDIRNGVEHQDAAPPDEKRCSELVEFAWYLLRSTDSLFTEIITDFELSPDTNFELYSHGLEVCLRDEDNWLLKFNGWLPDDFVAQSDPGEWIEVEILYLVRAMEIKDTFKRIEVPGSDGRDDDDWRIEGIFDGPPPIIRQIFRLCFEKG